MIDDTDGESNPSTPAAVPRPPAHFAKGTPTWTPRRALYAAWMAIALPTAVAVGAAGVSLPFYIVYHYPGVGLALALLVLGGLTLFGCAHFTTLRNACKTGVWLGDSDMPIRLSGTGRHFFVVDLRDLDIALATRLGHEFFSKVAPTHYPQVLYHIVRHVDSSLAQEWRMWTATGEIGSLSISDALCFMCSNSMLPKGHYIVEDRRRKPLPH